MINALKTMGEYKKEKSQESLIHQIVDNPNSSGNYDTVLLLVFKKEGGEVVFDEIEVEEFTLQKLDKYAYKFGSPRGGDLTPTSKVTDLEKTLNRVKKPLNKIEKDLEDSIEGKIIQGIKEELNREEVFQKILNRLNGIDFENRAILTLGYKVNEDLKYVGDFQIFISSLMNRYDKKFYYKSSYLKAEKESIGENNICYICSKEAKETYGYVSTFSFYTLDKKGFTSGGFDRGEAWKNYPVCPECAKILDLGRDYLEENLSARFSGLNYFIIPETVFGAGLGERTEYYEILESLEEHKSMSLKEDTQAALTRAEDDLFYVMSEFKNYVNFNLLFYESQQSAFRILLYVEDIIPSYLSKIFEAKNEVEEDSLFSNLTGQDGENFSLKFNFNLLSDFFYIEPNDNDKNDMTDQFLEVLDKIFTGRQISYQLLIKRFVEHLRLKYRRGESMWYDNLKGIMILKFLQKLDLLDYKYNYEGGTILAENENGYKEQLINFFENHEDVLDNGEKKLAFLEGVLAQKLLNIQRRKRDGSTPFQARLKGLKLNEKEIKRLYPEIINKLEQYDENYYKQLEELIADFALDCDFAKISNTELSFYFTTGMNQAHKFTFKNKEEE